MTGVEETVGGWFASSIIGKVIDLVGSYLGNNSALQSQTAEMLSSLENSLPQIQDAIRMASKMPTKTPGLIRWMDSVKNAAYEVKDVLDDFEAKRFRESFKGKNKVIQSGKVVKTLLLPEKELKELKSVVEKISKVFGEVRDFLDHYGNKYSTNTNTLLTNNAHTRETSSYLDPNAKIFGRDVEIYFILHMILNYQLVCFSRGNSEPESESTPSEEEPKLIDHRDGTSSFKGYGEGITRKRRRFSGINSEVGREGKGKEISTKESSVGEVERKGKGKEISSIVPRRRVSVHIRNWKLPVLPICGLGGVGKTTIAQMVYNNDIVTEIFDLRAWVYVPEIFDRKEIMIDIVRKLGGSDPNRDLDSIKHGLNNTIENKRVFLVLDDVHDGIESIWSDLYPVLGNGAPGSFVLVTTQSEHVAKTIGNMSNIIQLGVLEPEWFDLLFKYYAFGELFDFNPKSGTSWISCRNNVQRAQFYNMDEEKLSALKLIATEIAKKLHGLPLAGKVIGKMLHDRLEQEYWEGILTSEWWNEERAVVGIVPYLGIGYMDLDYELKQCFAFCSIFPKNYVFDRNRLVQMWMAHDFIQPNEEESRRLERGEIRLEDVGSKRFDKLVKKSFFQATISDGKYVMHDLIRELALSVSSKEFYYVKSLDNHLPISAHHLGIDCDGSKVEGIKSNNTSLRTIILFGNWENCSDVSISNIFAKSSGVHVLDLSYIGIAKDISIINSICKLSHLRFVDLSFSKTNFIPDKFCELYHLQVLDVRGCNFVKLPKDMNKLINLRHLYASTDTVNLISGIGKLTKLQELEEFRITRSENQRISELRDMNEISGHLLLTGLDNVKSKEEAATSQLAKKKYLKSLEFKFTHGSRVEQEVVEALKPPPSVKMFTIRGSRSREEYLPSWFWNLKFIHVGNSWLKTLPAFGELPSLEVLSLDGNIGIQTIGNEFYGRFDVKFPSLKKLTFSDMSLWTEWSDAPAGIMSFPHLEKIHVVNCRELKKMPTQSFTLSMVELQLLNCPKIHNIETIWEGIPSLTILSISARDDLSIDGTALRNLEVMRLRRVERVCFLRGLESLDKLRKLEIMDFNEIHGSFVQNRQLASLHMDHGSYSTQSLPMLGRLENLRFLIISNSPVTEYTVEEESWFNQLTSLETLEFFNCYELTRLPSTLPLLTKLKKLVIKRCVSISSLPEFGLPENLSSLETLEISECKELTRLPSTLPLLTKLKKLVIKRCESISSLPEFDLPESLSSLERLEVSKCLKLTHLPSTLPLLTKLKKLVIDQCLSISSLPEAGLPPNLTELYITGCSYELLERCKSNQGDDWSKISHIPHVVIERLSI